MNPITSFRGKFAFLSNFYPAPVEYEGLYFQNSEAAFQAAKTLNMTERKKFCNLSPKTAKKMGRHIKLRPDWGQVKDKIMEQIIYAKFNQNSQLRHKLLKTGNRPLIEGNNWGDTYWGICRGRGKNRLGQILMRVRNHMTKRTQKGGTR